jgi:RNA polymerase sigma-70 factor (ECF subfamily)
MPTANSIDKPADSDLLQRLHAGDKAAFTELVRCYHGPMQRVAAAIIGSAQAEEVVQEAWLAAMRHLGTFEGRSSLRTWLFTIVSNEAKSRLRKGRREVFIDDQPGGEELFASGRFTGAGHWAQPPGIWHDDSPEALLSHEDFQRCLEHHMGRFSEVQRAALLLRDYDELEFADICNILDISASNVRVLVHRARIKLHAMIEHFEETGTC